MKIPKKLNICGHIYKIEFVAKGVMMDGRLGECEHPARVIRILKGIEGYDAFMILLHEIRHAIHFETGLSQVLHPQTQEMDCEIFTSVLTSLFHLKFK